MKLGNVIEYCHAQPCFCVCRCGTIFLPDNFLRNSLKENYTVINFKNKFPDAQYLCNPCCIIKTLPLTRLIFWAACCDVNTLDDAISLAAGLDDLSNERSEMVLQPAPSVTIKLITNRVEISCIFFESRIMALNCQLEPFDCAQNKICDVTRS